MSKILLLSDPILATSLILSYDRNRKPSPMQFFSMVHGGQQSTIVPPILYPLSYAPYCHAFMHIFYMIFPLRWLVAWINMGSMQTPFPCQQPRFPNHIICLLSLVGRCPNKRLGSRFVNCVSSYEPTKPPARVWCGIINMRWKQIKVIMKAFFWSNNEIWDKTHLITNLFLPLLLWPKVCQANNADSPYYSWPPKSTLIYQECQMNRSYCLLSLWPQTRQ